VIPPAVPQGEVAEIRERAEADLAICEREQESCPRNSCYMPEVAQNARDLLRLLDDLELARVRCDQQERALEAISTLLPDGQHPGVRQFEDRITSAMIIARDALGDDDPGNVKMCYALAAELELRYYSSASLVEAEGGNDG